MHHHVVAEIKLLRWSLALFEFKCTLLVMCMTTWSSCLHSDFCSMFVDWNTIQWSTINKLVLQSTVHCPVNELKLVSSVNVFINKVHILYDTLETSSVPLIESIVCWLEVRTWIAQHVCWLQSYSTTNLVTSIKTTNYIVVSYNTRATTLWCFPYQWYIPF